MGKGKVNKAGLIFHQIHCLTVPAGGTAVKRRGNFGTKNCLPETKWISCRLGFLVEKVKMTSLKNNDSSFAKCWGRDGLRKGRTLSNPMRAMDFDEYLCNIQPFGFSSKSKMRGKIYLKSIQQRLLVRV